MIRQIIIFSAFITVLFSNTLAAQDVRRWEDIDTTGYFNEDMLQQNGITLLFINKDSLANLQSISALKEVFWKIYPEEMKRFNRKSPKTVTIMIGKEYKGVAASLHAVIKIDQDWIRNNPEDIDLLTHELMHVVQGYTYDVPDNWLTDGLADYARYAFGVNNVKSGWSLPPYHPGQSFKDSYRIAARFLVWAEKNKHKHLVERLDNALRNGSYNRRLWVKLTGLGLNELWSAYAANPDLNMPF